jgi:outer membrane protein TolC
MTCPTFVPTEAYYERVQKLEEAVLRAQAEVDVAEQAYRRGVD